MIYVVATLSIKPEARAELIAAAKECIAATRQESGNLAYDLNESVTDPSRMVFVEQWESADALTAHGHTPHLKAFGKAIAAHLTAKPKIEVITPANVAVR